MKLVEIQQKMELSGKLFHELCRPSTKRNQENREHPSNVVPSVPLGKFMSS
jgi:hypothetical protein